MARTPLNVYCWIPSFCDQAMGSQPITNERSEQERRLANAYLGSGPSGRNTRPLLYRQWRDLLAGDVSNEGGNAIGENEAKHFRTGG